MIIRKVWKAKKKNKDYQLLVTIPKDSKIKEGDYVKIERVENEEK